MWWFLPYINLDQPWVMAVPIHPIQSRVLSQHPESPSYLTPYPIPQGCPRAPALIALQASCIELALVIYFTYGNIHVSVLFSHIIPPFAFSHTVQKSVLYICVSFAILHIGSSEKAMAPHSSTLAWKIPWVEESGRLQSMELQRVGHY